MWQADPPLRLFTIGLNVTLFCKRTAAEKSVLDLQIGFMMIFYRKSGLWGAAEESALGTMLRKGFLQPAAVLPRFLRFPGF